LAGDITSWTHPAGYTITNTISAAQRITGVSSTYSDSLHHSVLASGITYTAWGAINSLTNGCVVASGSCTQVLETYQYNNRMQPTMLELGKSGNNTADFCWVYNYYTSVGNPTGCAAPSQGTGNNGNVVGLYDLDNNSSSMTHTEAYAYDNVNRLSTAVATGNSTYNLTFSYLLDGSNGEYGNMTCVQNSNTQGLCPPYVFNGGNNEISGYSYDAAGNVTSDGRHTYQWDAEGRLASVDNGATETYTYNFQGQQVRLNAPGNYTWDHLYDPAGNWIGRWSNNAWGVSGVFQLGGQPFSIYLDQAYFIHNNALGSTAMDTYAAGTVAGDFLYYPWGQGWAGASPETHFAAFPYADSETDFYPTLHRQYSPNQGRWMSPDPGGLSVADPSNPQTWDAYPYVTNNPTTLTDAIGLCGCGGGGGFLGGGGGGGGCGGGGGVYGGGGGGRPQPPAVLPIPGAPTVSVPGGSFPNPFTTSDQPPSPWFTLVDSLPMPPWSPTPPGTGGGGGGGGSCSEFASSVVGCDVGGGALAEIGSRGGGTKPSVPVLCDCILIEGIVRWTGCTYLCECQNGVIGIFDASCSIRDTYAWSPCPVSVVVHPANPEAISTADIVYPKNFCKAAFQH